MPQFTWTSRDPYDVVRSGIITAPTAHRAAAALASRSIKVDAVLPLPERLATTGAVDSEAPTPLDLASIRPADLLQSLREMVGLLRHGVSRQRVLTALGAATHHPVLAEVLQLMGQRTQAGSPIYQAMAAWPTVFDGVVQHLIRHGEGEDCLPQCIKAAYVYLEYQHAMAGLERQLQGQPQTLTRTACALVAQGRVLACLAAGQRAGLPLDTNLELAARHCGEQALSQRLPKAWQAAIADHPASDPEQRLSAALSEAGVVQPGAWREAMASAPSGDLQAALRGLAQACSRQATLATEEAGARFRWAINASALLAVAAVVAVMLGAGWLQVW
jgi:type II secretory pathway component PulF